LPYSSSISSNAVAAAAAAAAAATPGEQTGNARFRVRKLRVAALV